MPRFIENTKDGKVQSTVCLKASDSAQLSVLLHPHHGLCFAFFEGKGYSDGFTANLAHFLDGLQANDPDIRLTCSADQVCDACPNNRHGVCATQDKVEKYDRAVLSYCGLTEGDVLSYSSFAQTVQDKILNAGRRRDICGTCQWDEICSAHEDHSKAEA